MTQVSYSSKMVLEESEICIYTRSVCGNAENSYDIRMFTNIYPQISVYLVTIVLNSTGWPNKNRTFLRYHIFAATTDIITRFLLKYSEITAENNKRQFLSEC